jgi:hypothetical protein
MKITSQSKSAEKLPVMSLSEAMKTMQAFKSLMKHPHMVGKMTRYGTLRLSSS